MSVVLELYTVLSVSLSTTNITFSVYNIMDRSDSLRHQRATKHTKTKKKPVKVVYISNPMRFKASAAEFMALVQELTGQDSELPDPTKFSGAANDVGVNKVADNDGDHALEVPIVVDNNGPSRSDLEFEPFDHEVFTPQMLENFTGLLPSTLFCESLHLHG